MELTCLVFFFLLSVQSQDVMNTINLQIYKLWNSDCFSWKFADFNNIFSLFKKNNLKNVIKWQFPTSFLLNWKIMKSEFRTHIYSQICKFNTKNCIKKSDFFSCQIFSPVFSFSFFLNLLVKWPLYTIPDELCSLHCKTSPCFLISWWSGCRLQRHSDIFMQFSELSSYLHHSLTKALPTFQSVDGVWSRVHL